MLGSMLSVERLVRLNQHLQVHFTSSMLLSLQPPMVRTILELVSRKWRHQDKSPLDLSSKNNGQVFVWTIMTRSCSHVLLMPVQETREALIMRDAAENGY